MVVRAAAALGALSLVLGVGGCRTGGPSAVGDCPQATLAASPGVLRPGGDVVLTGEGFACDDAFFNGASEGDQRDRVAEVMWEQGDESISLGEVAVDGEGVLSGTVTAPDDATAGSATLVVLLGHASVDVTVG